MRLILDKHATEANRFVVLYVPMYRTSGLLVSSPAATGRGEKYLPPTRIGE